MGGGMDLIVRAGSEPSQRILHFDIDYPRGLLRRLGCRYCQHISSECIIGRFVMLVCRQQLDKPSRTTVTGNGCLPNNTDALMAIRWWIEVVMVNNGGDEMENERCKHKLLLVAIGASLSLNQSFVGCSGNYWANCTPSESSFQD